jgi:ketosteroid isomerase-like protein
VTVEESLSLVRDHLHFLVRQDEERYLAAYDPSCAIRFAGMPRRGGGVLQGVDQVRQNFREMAAHDTQAEVRELFGDGTNVCAVVRSRGVMRGRAYETTQCHVYRLESGRIQEETVYINYLDVFVR